MQSKLYFSCIGYFSSFYFGCYKVGLDGVWLSRHKWGARRSVLIIDHPSMHVLCHWINMLDLPATGLSQRKTIVIGQGNRSYHLIFFPRDPSGRGFLGQVPECSQAHNVFSVRMESTSHLFKILLCKTMTWTWLQWARDLICSLQKLKGGKGNLYTRAFFLPRSSPFCSSCSLEVWLFCT